MGRAWDGLAASVGALEVDMIEGGGAEGVDRVTIIPVQLSAGLAQGVQVDSESEGQLAAGNKFENAISALSPNEIIDPKSQSTQKASPGPHMCDGHTRHLCQSRALWEIAFLWDAAIGFFLSEAMCLVSVLGGQRDFVIRLVISNKKMRSYIHVFTSSSCFLLLLVDDWVKEVASLTDL